MASTINFFVGEGNWSDNADFVQWLADNKGPKTFSRCSEKTRVNWYEKYNTTRAMELKAEADAALARLDAEAEAKADEPANVNTDDEAEVPAEKPEKPAKAPKKKVADIAEEILADIDPALYTVDKKGRYKFEGFFITFKKTGTQIRFAPGKTFRKNHPDIVWENHPGWDNEFTTDVTKEFLLEAVYELMTEEDDTEAAKEVNERIANDTL